MKILRLYDVSIIMIVRCFLAILPRNLCEYVDVAYLAYAFKFLFKWIILHEVFIACGWGIMF